MFKKIIKKIIFIIETQKYVKKLNDQKDIKEIFICHGVTNKKRIKEIIQTSYLMHIKSGGVFSFYECLYSILKIITVETTTTLFKKMNAMNMEV